MRSPDVPPPCQPPRRSKASTKAPITDPSSTAVAVAAPPVLEPPAVSHEAILIEGLANGSFTPRPQAPQSESVSAVTAASGGTAVTLTPGRRQLRAAAEYQEALRRLNEAAAEVAGLWHELQVCFELI